MKAHLIQVSTIFILVSLAFLAGCKYDVAEPLWYQSYDTPPSPKINGITPISEAKPGVNTITIQGENFIVAPDTTVVYFNDVTADILSISSTSITVRRPNIASDSCTIKVVPLRAYTVGKFSPYKVYPVSEKFGSFLDNVALSVVAVDKNENLYVVKTDDRKVHQVTPDGTNTVIATATRAPWDGIIGPDGNLYLPGNNRAIDKVDLTAGTTARWTQMPSGKVVRFGDFDANGYYYTGGVKTDLCIVPPNPPASLTLSNITLAGSYANDEIFGVRIFGGYVYIVAKLSGSAESTKIWKHLITGNGTIAARELAYDMSQAGNYSGYTLKSFAFASDGTLFLGTDNLDALLRINLTTQQVEPFYKGILRPYCKAFCWGNENYIYMISGNTNPAEEWTVYRIDLGLASKP